MIPHSNEYSFDNGVPTSPSWTAYKCCGLGDTLRSQFLSDGIIPDRTEIGGRRLAGEEWVPLAKPGWMAAVCSINVVKEMREVLFRNLDFCEM
jgi:hypothetical protein